MNYLYLSDGIAIFYGYLLFRDIKYGVARNTDKPYQIKMKRDRSIYLGIIFTIYVTFRLLDLIGLINFQEWMNGK